MWQQRRRSVDPNAVVGIFEQPRERVDPAIAFAKNPQVQRFQRAEQRAGLRRSLRGVALFVDVSPLVDEAVDVERGQVRGSSLE
jgi:hypothetical protein